MKAAKERTTMTATCTHCNKPISRKSSRDPWEHSSPYLGLKAIACYKIVFATPRRGSIKK
jgi:hypothetical protein